MFLHFSYPLITFLAPRLIITRLPVVRKLVFTTLFRARCPKLALIGFVFQPIKSRHVAVILSGTSVYAHLTIFKLALFFQIASPNLAFFCIIDPPGAPGLPPFYLVPPVFCILYSVFCILPFPIRCTLYAIHSIHILPRKGWASSETLKRIMGISSRRRTLNRPIRPRVLLRTGPRACPEPAPTEFVYIRNTIFQNVVFYAPFLF